MSTDIKSRFMEKVRKDDSGCWYWESTLHRDGYGKFSVCNKQTQAHRVSFEIFVGPCKGSFVLHKCDNRRCVNPDHLYLGDAKQNAKDRSDRHRYKVRLPLSAVEEIRNLYKAGGISQAKLGEIYGVDQTQVSKYVRKTQRIHT